MAVVPPSSPQTLEGNLNKSDAGNSPLPSSAASPSATAAVTSAFVTSAFEETPPSDPPNPDPPSVQANPAPVVPPPPPPVSSFAPSFRPLGAPHVAPHYGAVSTPMAQNPGFQAMVAPQAPGVQPPGVPSPGSILPPGAVNGAVAFQGPLPPPAGSYQIGAGQQMSAVAMAYGQVPNGYMPVPTHPPLPMHPPASSLGHGETDRQASCGS